MGWKYKRKAVGLEVMMDKDERRTLNAPCALRLALHKTEEDLDFKYFGFFFFF